MKMTWIWGGALALTGWAAGVAAAPSLQTIEVEGLSRPRMRGDKPEALPQLSFKEPILEALARGIDAASPGDRLFGDPALLLPPRLASDLAASPWQRWLTAPPALDLAVSQAPGFSIAHWTLTVSDDQGSVFRTIKGRGRLPGRIDWDGLDEQGEPLRVGHDYSCALSAVDEFGIPYYIASKTVRLAGYVLPRPGRVRLWLDSAILFSPNAGLSRDGQQALREARDRLRGFYRGAIAVEAYARDAQLALQQAELVREFLARSLRLDAARIRARGHAADDYWRVEITGR